MPPELAGIVVVDKPGGISSAGVVARIKGLFGAAKVGHAGTLDPFATGVLICCLNRATRISRFLLAGDKAYEAELVLGVATDTQDATGVVVERHPVAGLSDRQVRQAAGRFIGTIHQVPPAYSALKHQGTPLYKLARRGVAVEKAARPVRIDRLEIREVALPVVRFSVVCSSGTYVRTLCADLGRALGCGGHLGALRRTVSSGFGLDRASSLEDLEACRWQAQRLAERVIPLNAALPFLPATVVDGALAGKIRNGVKLTAADFAVPPPVSPQGWFRAVAPEGALVAVLAVSATPGHFNYGCVFSRTE